MPDTPEKAVKDEFHRQRSRFLDAFSRLEEALLSLPEALKDEHVAETVKSFRMIRNDIVHSRMRFVDMDGEILAVAINTHDCTKLARPARLLKIQDFKELSKQVLKAQKGLQSAA